MLCEQWKDVQNVLICLMYDISNFEITETSLGTAVSSSFTLLS